MRDNRIEAVLKASEKGYKLVEDMHDDDYSSGEFAWEKCYLAFADAWEARQKVGEVEEFERRKKLACLRLADYLVSWGMYRGSSFISHCSAQVHMGAVNEILESKYDVLRTSEGIVKNDDGFAVDPGWLNTLFELESVLQKHYQGVREKEKKWSAGYEELAAEMSAMLSESSDFPSDDSSELEEGEGESEPTGDAGSKGASDGGSPVSQTLITKILLGTLGCVPAYDRYFCRCAKEFSSPGNFPGVKRGEVPQTFSKASYRKFCTFFLGHWGEVQNAAKEMTFLSVGEEEAKGRTYPPMKLIDKGMWVLGKAYEGREKKAKAEVNKATQ